MQSPLRPARTHLLIVALLLLTTGCASVAGLQDCQFSCTNKLRAQSAWGDCYSREQQKILGNDFRAGFKKGYYDTAMGKDCRLPPVAPPKYWSAKYQTCEHRQDVDRWFAGYQQGIISAQSKGFGAASEIPVAPGAPVLNVEGCGACYSPDNCNCSQPGNCLIDSPEFCIGNSGTAVNCD